MTRVHMVTIEQVGDSVGRVGGHALHGNDNESAAERPPVHGMHRGGPGDMLDPGYRHVAHT